MKNIARKRNSLLKIHLAVFGFGLSGLFAKLLTLPSTIIVLGRVFFASTFLFISLLYIKEDIRLKHKKDYLTMSVLGFILALHWTTFFYAIQVSTVAIGLLSYSTFPVFVAFIEPIFFKEKIHPKHVMMACITFCGVMLVVPSFTLTNQVTQGVCWGMLSGFTFALLSILNKKFTEKYSSMVIAFYQDLVATLVLLPFFFLVKPTIHINDLLLLAFLGIVFTGIAHTFFISSLRRLSAQTTSIIASLEPVYGIIFAALLFSEIPSLQVVLGGLIILGTALYATLTL